MPKPIKVLVMSVGPIEKNGTVKFLTKIGAKELACVCLPKQYEENADGYRKKGIEVYIYDEKKYINGDFEYFGFRPRNCGGIGRQGIAEATDKYNNEYLCFQLDDDTSRYIVRDSASEKSTIIREKSQLERIIRQFDSFYKSTGIMIAGRTGPTPPSGSFMSSPKMFNNFMMYSDDPWRYKGFRALCSDDYRYGLYVNLYAATPTISTELVSISFTQNQGDRNDGNAVIYNGDCSWKKAFALRMICPWSSAVWIKKESNRVLFREHLNYSTLYPPICVCDKDGKITGRLA